MRTAIVTHYVARCEPQRQFWALSKANNEAWAKRLGWEFFADEKRRMPSIKLIYREKSAIITEVMAGMQDGDRLLWLDGDAVIVADPSGIWDALGKADIGMVKFRAKHWNSGVVPINVNAASKEMWAEVVTHRHEKDQPAADAMIDGKIAHAVCEVWDAHECENCPWTPGNRGPLCGSHKTKVVELDRRWNEHHDKRDADTKIVGMHMMEAWATLKAMQETLRG